jgi:hypothetical protein
MVNSRKSITYSEAEKNAIIKEIQALFNARQQPINHQAISEWLLSFKELGFSANVICKLFRLAKYYITKNNISFADLIALQDRLSEVPDIIKPPQIPETTHTEEMGLSEFTFHLMEQAKSLRISFVVYISIANELGINLDNPQTAKEFYNFMKSLNIPKGLSYDSILQRARASYQAQSITGSKKL